MTRVMVPVDPSPASVCHMFVTDVIGVSLFIQGGTYLGSPTLWVKDGPYAQAGIPITDFHQG